MSDDSGLTVAIYQLPDTWALYVPATGYMACLGIPAITEPAGALLVASSRLDELNLPVDEIVIWPPAKDWLK